MRAFVAAHLKDMNRKTVYKLISSIKEISKAEISRQTGISSPTVIKIANFFLENGFVMEAGEGDSALGRKPQILKFNPDAAFSIGVEMEGDFLRLGIVNLEGEIKAFKQMSVSPDFDKIVKQELGSSIESIIREIDIPREKVLGVGVGIPGVLDAEKYVIDFAPLINIHDLRDCRDLFDDLSKSLNLPVFIENDVNAAAIGEFVTRKLGPEQDLIYVSLGTGLGAGIILNGKLRRGKRNSAGEIGYTVFDRDFHTSKTKAGWMESLINLQALAEKWNFSPSIGVQSVPADELVLMTDYVASNLALCIANLSMQIDTDRVVIGGITAEILGDPLIKAVQKYILKLCLFDTDVQFQYCQEPGVVGAASIVSDIRLDELLTD